MMEPNSHLEETIERYLGNKMSPEEKTLFEVEMASSPALQELVSIHQQMDSFYSEEEWVQGHPDKNLLLEKTALFEEDDTKAFAEKLKNFREAERKKSPRISTSLYYWLAGIASVVLVLWALLPKETVGMQDLYLQYYQAEDIGTLHVKGDDDDPLLQIEKDFRAQNYQATMAKASPILDTLSRPNVTLLLYLGNAQLQLNQFEEAEATFNTIIHSNTLDFHKGYWYQSLLFLKKEDKVRCMDVLEVISEHPSYFKHEAAKALLKDLKD
ncbi:MAG: hypothetical protein R2793_09870 [Flavobacteriaceae bacterium]